LQAMRATVAVCVRGAGARDRVRRALAQGDLDVVLVTPEELAVDPIAVAGCLGVIYDLEPMTSASVELVAALRSQQPWLPILLYPALNDGVLELTLGIGGTPGVYAKEQVPDSLEVGRLKEFIERCLRAAPTARVTTLVSLLLADAPPRILEFTRVAVHRLARPNCDRTVMGLADALELTPRTLQRAWPRQDLPQPKELLDWLVLLVVAHVAVWSGVTVRTVSRILGVEPNTFYRLRLRLMPKAPRPHGEQPGQEFDLVLLAFAERCRVPRQRANDIVRSAAGQSRGTRSA